jgi:hypothetical protein
MSTANHTEPGDLDCEGCHDRGCSVCRPLPYPDGEAHERIAKHRDDDRAAEREARGNRQPGDFYAPY